MQQNSFLSLSCASFRQWLREQAASGLERLLCGVWLKEHQGSIARCIKFHTINQSEILQIWIGLYYCGAASSKYFGCKEKCNHISNLEINALSNCDCNILPDGKYLDSSAKIC